MTDFKGMGRMKNMWNKLTHRSQHTDSQDLNGKADQQEAVVPLWRKKRTQLIVGAAVLTLVAGLIFYQQYTKYIKANTFEFFHVFVDGEEIGTVNSPDQVVDLVDKKKEALQTKNPGLRMQLNTGLITYESDSAFKPAVDAEQTIAKLSSSFTAHAQGVEVKVNDKVIGVVKDQETADNILSRIQGKYAPEFVAESKNTRNVRALSYNKNEANNESANAAEISKKADLQPGRTIDKVEFVEDVALADTNTQPDAIEDEEKVYKRLIEGSAKPIKYVVKEGDCVGCIANQFDISPQVIYENNPWIKDDMIRVGDELDLTAIQPEVTVRTSEKLVELESIAAPVEVQKNDELPVGQRKVIQHGVEGKQRLVYQIFKENGYVTSEELVEKEIIQEPVPEIVEKGTMVVIGEGSGKFAYPLSSYKITSKFGPRWGRQHKGIDFTGSKSILSSDAGVVEFAGRKGSLGNLVIIDHKNGYKTYYGHMSSFKVSKGDKVSKGEGLGTMGNTGNSTGTHLHFEIHKDGVAQNPMKYL
ncbi:peptidoglycan DD-metalloendopeptidase family protein [Paenibacillus yanchengensis]|uniref:Peptidoglycan DD-metalloendopeptidase family protein n=1 Tax=Paenibacillus yanchengensis TaxID=2035833 RepID=A0ABW4YPI2_9BACL